MSGAVPCKVRKGPCVKSKGFHRLPQAASIPDTGVISSIGVNQIRQECLLVSGCVSSKDAQRNASAHKLERPPAAWAKFQVLNVSVRWMWSWLHRAWLELTDEAAPQFFLSTKWFCLRKILALKICK